MGLYYTGHSIVDMGISIITVFSGKEQPEDVTEEDLKKVSDTLEEYYGYKYFTGFSSILFTSNFLNPSWKKENVKAYVAATVRSNIPLEDLPVEVQTNYPESAKESFDSNSKCIYCDRQSLRKISRDLVPLLTGRDVINFDPYGVKKGICGYCILALQALILGTPKCEGKAIIIDSSDTILKNRIVDKWIEQTSKFVYTYLKIGKEPPNINRPKTRLIEVLKEIQKETNEYEKEEKRPSEINIYHISNSGQGPDIKIFSLPSVALRLLELSRMTRFSAVWDIVEKESWEVKKEGKGKAKKEEYVEGENKLSFEEKLSARNYLYEDLYDLPDNAIAFLRKHFINPKSIKSIVNESLNSGREKLKLIDFIEMFVREVMCMEKSRIEAIKRLANALAKEIMEYDKSIWNDIYMVKADFSGYQKIRNLIIKTSAKLIKRGQAPLVTLDEFLEIFEEGEEIVKSDWRFAWDLVIIGIIEELYNSKFDFKEILKEENEKEEK